MEARSPSGVTKMVVIIMEVCAAFGLTAYYDKLAETGHMPEPQAVARTLRTREWAKSMPKPTSVPTLDIPLPSMLGLLWSKSSDVFASPSTNCFRNYTKERSMTVRVRHSRSKFGCSRLKYWSQRCLDACRGFPTPTTATSCGPDTTASSTALYRLPPKHGLIPAAVVWGYLTTTKSNNLEVSTRRRAAIFAALTVRMGGRRFPKRVMSG